MSRQITHILSLTDALAEHLGVTHWAISMRVARKGDMLNRLREGGDLRTKSAERVFCKLSENWPEDLEWPSDIPRPAAVKDPAQ